MHHKTLEVKATATDLGEFSAIAAAYTVDRTNERIVPGAFEKSIESWQTSGKMIPLHWDHSGAPEDIIGVVDPSSMKETDDGLMVAGRLDLEGSDVAKQAWRLMKANSVALSFGYMVQDSAEAKDGVRELKALDLFEISITPAPANPDTRFLALKSVKAMNPEEMKAEIGALRDRLDEMEKSLEGDSKDVPPPTEVEGATEQTETVTPQASDADPFTTALLEAALPTRSN